MFSRFPSGSTNPGFVPFCSQIIFHCLRLLLFPVTWNNLCFRKLAGEVGQEEARWSCKAKEWVGKSFLDACRGGSWPRRGRHGTLLWREDLVIEWLQGRRGGAGRERGTPADRVENEATSQVEEEKVWGSSETESG